MSLFLENAELAAAEFVLGRRAARVWVSSLHNNRVLLSASPKVEQKSKNWEKCSTAALKICARVSGSRTKKQKLGKMFYRDPQKPRGLVSYHIGKCCQNQPARSPSS